MARLHLQADLPRSLAAELGGPVRVAYHLHPPILRALGWKRKIRLGTWFDGVFRLLVRMRRLRGTAFDPFGHAEVRCVEGLIDAAVRELSAETYERAVSGRRGVRARGSSSTIGPSGEENQTCPREA